MVRSRIYATWQGKFVIQTLQNQSNALVSGIASRGLYLQPKDGLMIYLSLDPFRGSLTINIPAKSTSLGDIEPGSQINLGPTSIRFPKTGLQIDLGESQIWQVDPPKSILSQEHLPTRYQAILNHADKLTVDHDLSLLLLAATGRDPENRPAINGYSGYQAALMGLDIKDLFLSLGQLQDIVGLGPGLTPLGDDIILGILLSLNRWKHIILPDRALKEFNLSLLEGAKEKTNQISYSLFACAAEGSGDERLLAILDSFFSGEEPSKDQLEDFLSWGSSSGIGVLAGILAVVNNYMQ